MQWEIYTQTPAQIHKKTHTANHSETIIIHTVRVDEFIEHVSH